MGLDIELVKVFQSPKSGKIELNATPKGFVTNGADIPFQSPKSGKIELNRLDYPKAIRNIKKIQSPKSGKIELN